MPATSAPHLAVSVQDLAAELLDIYLLDDPLDASLWGIPGYDDRLPDLGVDGQQEEHSRLASLAARAEITSYAGLDEGEHQTLDFVRQTASVRRDEATIPLVEWTIGDFFFAPVAYVVTTLPKLAVDTAERAQGYLARLRALPEFLTVAAQRHAEGTKAGRPAVARLVKAAMTQLDQILADPTLCGITRTHGRGGVAFGEATATLADEVVRPALAGYRDALGTLVLGSARDDAHCGLTWLPDGDGMYEILVRRHTSAGHTPEELHTIGIELVDEVTAEFRDTGSRLWGLSDASEIFARLTSDESLRFVNSAEMLDVARQAVGRAEAVAPRWFDVMPDQPCVVEAVPSAEESGSPAAYYIQGAIDGSRPSTYFVNTSKPWERYRHLAEAVAFHEAVPGHHFQVMIALAQTDLPLARRVMYDTACAEGWGLYAERLADEMGLYSDDIARLGMLTNDAWRAGRLVVDTGLHHFGWSRQQAVDWMRQHVPMAPLEIETEIDRYITDPGQALAYMVGRLEISRLRQYAAAQLGEGLDLRAFHDLVLRVGSLPLGALVGVINRWVGSLASGSRDATRDGA